MRVSATAGRDGYRWAADRGQTRLGDLAVAFLAVSGEATGRPGAQPHLYRTQRHHWRPLTLT
jgi:hypothetical protein